MRTTLQSFRSLEDKEGDQHDGMEEVISDINNLTELIQDQERCSDENIEFENEINDKLKDMIQSLPYKMQILMD